VAYSVQQWSELAVLSRCVSYARYRHSFPTRRSSDLVGVEVQIFYKLSGDDFQNHEIELAKLFNGDDWEIDTSRNRIKDPDTKQWTKVFYFSKILKVKEGI